MSNDDRAAAFNREMETGAATMKALLSGQATPGGSSLQPAATDALAAEARGAEETRALIAVAGQPGAHRDGAAGAAGGTDAAAGAAEARRLLGKE